MENKRKLSIEYIDRFYKSGEVIMPHYTSMKVTTSHTKRYHNCLYHLAGLQGCARNLMDYLADTMDSNNHISTSKANLDIFIGEMNKAGVKYGIDAVNQAVRKLKNKNFLFQVGRGYYQVNPKYFMKNDDTKRADLIKIMLEFNVRDEITNIDVEDNREE